MPTHLSSQPRLTKRLLLRPFRRRDATGLHESVTASLDDLQPWLPWAEGYNRGVAQRFIRESIAAWSEGRAFDFTIRAIEDPDRHVGNVSVWPTSPQNHIGEIGYWIRSDENGRGFASEATARAIQIAFEEMNLHKVQLRIAVGNVASDRIAEKLGFQQEGILRDEVRVEGRWLDHTIWSMLEQEWWRHRERHRAEEMNL